MKKLSMLLLLLALCLSFAPAQAETEGDFVYAVRDGRAIVTAYTGSAAGLIVPDTLGGYPVTAIGYCAFRGCASLTQVTLPHGVTSIGSRAFQRCASLREVNLPDTLTNISTHAFHGCAKLTQIALPESIERVHPYAFYGCSARRICAPDSRAALVLTAFGYSFTCPEYPQFSLRAHEDGAGRRTLTVADCDEDAVCVSFPEGVTAIDGYAFFGCASLAEISIPDGVREIPDSAFEGCASLTQIALPTSVEIIDDSAFSRCPDLVILAPAGSAGQAFAEQNAADGFTWRAR